MSCERMESRILAYMDGRMKDNERAEMDKHLAVCPVCRVRANEFRSVSDLLGQLPMVEPTSAFDVRVAAGPVKQSWWRGCGHQAERELQEKYNEGSDVESKKK